MQAMPMLVLGLAALAWIIVRRVALRRAGGQAGATARRDLWVGLAVAASWFAVWALYSAYYWTNDPTENTLQTARFYVPAIGAISLLGAWLVTRIPGRAWLAGVTSAAVITAMFVLGAWSFHVMLAAQQAGRGGFLGSLKVTGRPILGAAGGLGVSHPRRGARMLVLRHRLAVAGVITAAETGRVRADLDQVRADAYRDELTRLRTSPDTGTADGGGHT
jgi:hypothetical protein